MQELSQSKGYSYNKVGGMERALKLTILEFPFAFWQWGNNINDMPQPEEDDYNEIFNYLVRVSSPDFFDDKAIENLQAFYYAALTETGMYAYNTKPFKKFFKNERNRSSRLISLCPKVTKIPRSTRNSYKTSTIGYKLKQKISSSYTVAVIPGVPRRST